MISPHLYLWEYSYAEVTLRDSGGQAFEPDFA